MFKSSKNNINKVSHLILENQHTVHLIQNKEMNRN
jgi:hypothetical protein